MCSKQFFFVVVCFFLCLCKGAPVGQTDGNIAGARYTDEEDRFIITEVSRLVEWYNTIYSKEMWTEISKTHREKWLQGTNGFPQARSYGSLCYHFINVILKTYEKKGEEMPAKLIERIALLQQTKTDRGSKRLNQRSYTTEEDNLIFDELLNPSCTSVFGISTLKSIVGKLNKKHQDKVPGFENERTFHGLRSYLRTMKRKPQFPEDIMKKFRLLHQGVSSSDSSSQDQQTDSRVKDIPVNNDGQVENEEQDDEEWVHEMLEQLQNNKDFDVDH